MATFNPDHKPEHGFLLDRTGEQQTFYVYLLSWHDEYGAETVHATLNRDALLGLLREAYPYPGRPSRNGEARYLETLRQAESKLAELLQETDEKLADPGTTRENEPAGAMPHNLCIGWGGPQLHVVRLECGP